MQYGTCCSLKITKKKAELFGKLYGIRKGSLKKRLKFDRRSYDFKKVRVAKDVAYIYIEYLA